MYKPKAQAQSGQTVMDGAQPSNAKRVVIIPPDLKVNQRYIHHPFCVNYPSDVSGRKSQELVAESNLLRTIQKGCTRLPREGPKRRMVFARQRYYRQEGKFPLRESPQTGIG